MSRLLKQFLAVFLAFQLTLPAAPAVHAEETDNNPEVPLEVTEETEEEASSGEEPGDAVFEEEIIEEDEEQAPVTEDQPAEETGESGDNEETVIPEESETPEVQEITEEPELPGIPEVTEEPEVPEETEEPEVPEETEIPAETEEPEISGGNEDIPVMAEPGAIHVKSEPIGDKNLFEDASKLEIKDVVWSSYDSITVSAIWKQSAPANIFLIAENSTTRYYLDVYELPPSNVTFKYEDVVPGLPEGLYTLRVGTYDAGFDHPTLRVSPVFGKTLRVLPVPQTVVSKEDDGSGGAIQIKLPDMTYISKLYCSGEHTGTFFLDSSELTSGAVKGVYTLSSCASDTYSMYYDGTSSGTTVTISGGISVTSVPKTTAPEAINAWVEKNGTQYGDYWDPLIMEYVGETAKISCSLMTYSGEVDDTRLVYKSGNTKVVSVDAVGNIRAVGKGEAAVTVTSAADPSATAGIVYVKVEPLSPKSFKFDYQKGVPEYGQPPVISRKISKLTYTLLLTTDNVPSGADVPVTFTVTGGDGLKIYPGTATGSGTWPSAADYFSNYVSTYTRKIETNYGEPRAQIHLMAVGGGHYTVTAEALGKKATCTIDVDGFSSVSSSADPNEGAQFFRAGKPVTGWITFKDDKFIYGAAGIKPDSEGLAGRNIYYVDPSSKKTVEEGIYKIGGKLYYFDSTRELVHETAKETYNARDTGTGRYDEICVSEEGYLLSGWQDVDTDYDYVPDTYHYYDQATGFIVRNAWVPVRSGSGVTWVDGSGETLDDDGYSLDNNGASYNDGFHRINGNWYYFEGGYKKGARKTGWVYLTANSSGQAVPSPQKTAVMKAYCDPNNNGQVATGNFWVGGKEYRTSEIYREPDNVKIDAAIYLPGQFAEQYESIKNVKYMLSVSGSNIYIIGPDGSIAKNMLVQAYHVLSAQLEWMYATADGKPAMEVWISDKGKSYYFNEYGIFDPEGVPASDTGLYVDTAGHVLRPVYAKPVNSKKPTDGYYYYDPDDSRLTSILLVDSYRQPVMVLDKSGRPGVNTLVSAEQYQDGPVETYAAWSDGTVFWSGYPASGHSDNTILIKGKLYAVDPEEHYVLKNGLVPISWDSYGEPAAFGYADKTGALKRNEFGKVTINSTEYTMYFENNGEANADEIPVIKGKPYKTETVTDYYGNYYGYEFRVIYKPAEAGWTPGTESMYVNKDGSLGMGFLTWHNGKKMYYTLRGGNYYTALSCWNSAPYPTIWKIGGKLYLFSSRLMMVTGWVHFDKVIISDLAADEYGETYSDAMFYFDPKTGAAVSGGYKTVPAPVFKGRNPAFGMEDIGIEENHGYTTHAVNTSSSNAKLYFSNDGVLIRNTEYSISGKVYKFGPDGSIAGGTGWTDSNKMYYIVKNGQLATGRTKIGGQYYFFDQSGRKQTDRLIKSGNKWYYYDENGIQAQPVLKFYPTDYKLYGSPDGVNLTAVWAKDGALTQIVYTGSGKPASGETVNFGSYDPDYDIYSSFVLDSKGLPQTGAVYGVSEGGSANAHIYEDDGTKVSVGNDGAVSLVQSGKKYYVIDNDAVQVQEHMTYVTVDGVTDTLNAADRKTMAFFGEMAYNHVHGELYVIVDKDGSVVSDRAVSLMIDGEEKVWHTNRLGIPMEMYTPIYKFGGKWYADGVYYTEKLYGDDYVAANIRVKENGELIGFYNAETGKAVSGVFSNEVWFVSLKNGKPQTGSFRSPFSYQTYYLDPQAGAYVIKP